MVFKFLGLGKKSEFFLEAEPQSTENGSKSPETKSAKAEATPTHVETKEVPVAKVAKPEATPTQPTAKSTKANKPAKETVAPAPVAKTAAPKAEATNFATDYLIPNNTPRRRPGPSLDMYKDMARQMNNK